MVERNPVHDDIIDAKLIYDENVEGERGIVPASTTTNISANYEPGVALANITQPNLETIDRAKDFVKEHAALARTSVREILYQIYNSLGFAANTTISLDYVFEDSEESAWIITLLKESIKNPDPKVSDIFSAILRKSIEFPESDPFGLNTLHAVMSLSIQLWKNKMSNGEYGEANNRLVTREIGHIAMQCLIHLNAGPLKTVVAQTQTYTIPLPDIAASFAKVYKICVRHVRPHVVDQIQSGEVSFFHYSTSQLPKATNPRNRLFAGDSIDTYAHYIAGITTLIDLETDTPEKLRALLDESDDVLFSLEEKVLSTTAQKSVVKLLLLFYANYKKYGPSLVEENKPYLRDLFSELTPVMEQSRYLYTIPQVREQLQILLRFVQEGYTPSTGFLEQHFWLYMSLLKELLTQSVAHDELPTNIPPRDLSSDPADSLQSGKTPNNNTLPGIVPMHTELEIPPAVREGLHLDPEVLYSLWLSGATMDMAVPPQILEKKFLELMVDDGNVLRTFTSLRNFSQRLLDKEMRLGVNPSRASIDSPEDQHLETLKHRVAAENIIMLLKVIDVLKNKPDKERDDVRTGVIEQLVTMMGNDYIQGKFTNVTAEQRNKIFQFIGDHFALEGVSDNQYDLGRTLNRIYRNRFIPGSISYGRIGYLFREYAYSEEGSILPEYTQMRRVFITAFEKGSISQIDTLADAFRRNVYGPSGEIDQKVYNEYKSFYEELLKDRKPGEIGSVDAFIKKFLNTAPGQNTR